MTKLLLLGLAFAGAAGAEPRQESETRRELSHVAKVLAVYRARCGQYPSVEEGLDALTQPKSCLGQPLLSKVGHDGWGRFVDYQRKGEGFQLTSFGRDGKEGGEGEDADIVVTN